jgi:hypothetical protein
MIRWHRGPWVVGGEAAVQRGEHAGKRGTIRQVVSDGGVRLLLAPHAGSSWSSFWVAASDVAGIIEEHEPESHGQRRG